MAFGAENARCADAARVPRGERTASAIDLKCLSKNHREHFGRGPTTVRTTIQQGFVISFLEGIYTPVERTLIEAGKHDLVMQTRLTYQDAQRDEFKQIVEGVTDRRVRAFMSQNHINPDIATEIFVLEPNGDQPADNAT